MNVSQILSKLKSTASINEKVSIIEDNFTNQDLIDVFFYTYNPRLKFNINKIPEYNKGGNIPLSDILPELLKLHDRVYSGNAGIEHLAKLLSSVDQPDVLELIIDRDLNVGVSTSLINRVFKDLIPEEPYQGCVSFSDKLAKELLTKKRVVSQIKADGQYVNAVITDNINLKARSGEAQYFNGKIIRTLQSLNLSDVVFNGEFTIKGVDRHTANGILRSIISINKKIAEGEDVAKEVSKFIKKHGKTIEEFEENITYIVWDMIPHHEYLAGKGTEKYCDRWNKLTIIIKDCDNIVPVESKLVDNFAEAIDEFKSALDRGEEGTVIKDFDEVWIDGKHSHQLKMKLEMELDLEIIGFNEGSKGGKYEGTLGSLIVKTSCGILVTSCGGLKEKSGLREDIWNNQEKYLGKIAVIKCNGLSKNRQGGNSLFFPAFQYIREDKTVANSFQECLEIQEMKVSLS